MIISLIIQIMCLIYQIYLFRKTIKIREQIKNNSYDPEKCAGTFDIGVQLINKRSEATIIKLNNDPIWEVLEENNG